MSTLTCPKCHGEMRSYERSGIQLEQCGECRGVFLDRGELERLIEAEGSYYERDSAPPSSAYDERSREHGGGYGHHGGAKHQQGKRRKGFLGDLFD